LILKKINAEFAFYKEYFSTFSFLVERSQVLQILKNYIKFSILYATLATPAATSTFSTVGYKPASAKQSFLIPLLRNSTL